MELFECPSCSHTLYFDSLVCESCGTDVVYGPGQSSFVQMVSCCSNRQTIGCNWQAETTHDGLCKSCSLTTQRPDASSPDNLQLWAKTETAKRWVLANLAAWGWFSTADTGTRPEFHLLSEQTRSGERPVSMGHENSVVTINARRHDPIAAEAVNELTFEPVQSVGAGQDLARAVKHNIW